MEENENLKVSTPTSSDGPAVIDNAVKHSKFSQLLNKYFHHIDRGSSLKREITAGILLCILSVCGIFMNMQLVMKMQISGAYADATTEQLAANGEIIASLYFFSMIVSFLGSLLIGILARLPIVQTSGLGLSSVMMSLIGTSQGLTYYNLLAVCFISSIAYAAIVSIPVVKKWIDGALPEPVKKAIPAAMGILLAFVAIQLSGLVTLNGSSLSAYGIGQTFDSASSSINVFSSFGWGSFSYTTDARHPALLICFLSTLLTLILIFVFKARKAKHPYLWPLLLGTFFLLACILLFGCINWQQMSFTTDQLLGRAWMIGSEDAMQLHLSAILNNFSFGALFTKGFDFSAYDGNVFLLFLTGILTMTFATLYSNQATASVVHEHIGKDVDLEKDIRIANYCSAGMNFVAPFFGVSPIAFTPESCANSEEGSKSGISTLVASIGMLISSFIWIIPALFATTYSTAVQMNVYGHYGKTLQLISECSFTLADIVMVVVGLSMIKNSLGIEKDFKSFVPFIATIAGTVLLNNIAFGVGIGCIAYSVIGLLLKPQEGQKKLDSIKEIPLSTYIMSGVFALNLILFMCL